MRVPSIALAAAIVAGAALPAPALARDTAQPPQASLDDTGRLTLDFRVDRFVVRDGRLAARGTAVAQLAGPGSATRTVRERVTAPARIAQAARRRCSLITLSLAPLPTSP
jgi:hypothetical protein